VPASRPCGGPHYGRVARHAVVVDAAEEEHAPALENDVPLAGGFKRRTEHQFRPCGRIATGKDIVERAPPRAITPSFMVRVYYTRDPKKSRRRLPSAFKHTRWLRSCTRQAVMPSAFFLRFAALACPGTALRAAGFTCFGPHSARRPDRFLFPRCRARNP
jgi:hypothetical protein